MPRTFSRFRKTRSGAADFVAASFRLADNLLRAAGSSVIEALASVPDRRMLSVFAPSSSTVLDQAMAVLLAIAVASVTPTPRRSGRATGGDRRADGRS